MSIPVVIQPPPFGDASPIGLSGGTLNGATWSLNVTDVAVMIFAVASSGNSNPLVTVQVNWGDGTVDNSEQRPIGRPFQYIHQYSLPGLYAINVTATNTDGAVSSPNVTEVTVIEDRKSITQPVSNWVGLALPSITLAKTFTAVQSITAPEVVDLLATANFGNNYIVVDSYELCIPNAQVTITQPGKLITSGRVVSSNETIVMLNTVLNDTYSPGLANVEVQSTVYSSVLAQQQADKNQVWAFPSVADITLVQAAISMILGTNPGERVMLPTFGSALRQIPFEQNDTITAGLVQKATVDAIQQWEPRAQVVNFNLSQNGNAIGVFVTCTLANNSQAVFNITFSLNAP